MKRYWLTFLITVSLSFAGLAYSNATPLKPYQLGDWRGVIQSANGAPMAIHFLGVTCPACVKEMPQWGSFIKANPKARVVFIQVDDVSAESVKRMLGKAGLEVANNYSVTSPFDERLRYEIDPGWHGETPTTIILDENGKATRKTGLINFHKLQSALNGKF